MEEKILTVKDVISMTIDELRSLSIPADLLDSFGPPIARSLNNLRQIIQSIEQTESKAKAQEDAAEPQIEIVEDPEYKAE